MEIVVSYHEPNTVMPGSDIKSSRIDVGCFVDNGAHPSAPGFFSVYFLGDETRVYDDAGRIQSVEYVLPGKKGQYADPMVHTGKQWRDEYLYTDDGALIGWTRHRNGEEPARYTLHGARVLELDAQGRPLRAQSALYVPDQANKDQAPVLIEKPGPMILVYAYDGPEDQRGRIAERLPTTQEQ